MCLACEESEQYYRWELIQQIAKGEMPSGMTENDLRAMELPLPGELEIVEDPDGTQIIRRRVAETAAVPEPQAMANPFACDSPD